MLSKEDIILFPGQGSQSVKMGSEFLLLEDGKKRLEEAEKISSLPLSDLIFKGPESELSNTVYTQPAIYTVSSIVYDYLIKRFSDSDFILAGHSLGEVSAAYGSGAVSFEDALRFVKLRASLMSNATAKGFGSMAAVIGIDRLLLKEKLEQFGKELYVANYNSEQQTVISGKTDALDQFEKIAPDIGIRKIIRLSVSGPFHTKFMKEVEEQLREYIKTVYFEDPRYKLIRNCDGRLVSSKEEIKEGLISHISSPVLWVDSMNLLKSLQISRAIEVAPGKVLSTLLKRIDPDISSVSINTIGDLDKI